MTPPRERNDRRRPAGGRPGWEPTPPERADPPRHSHPARPREGADAWVWGWHAVEAALANPRREPSRLLVTADRLRQAEPLLGERAGRLRAEPVDAAELTRTLPPGAAHQGIGLRAAPPAATGLEELARSAAGLLVVLDQITDPQNIGAVFRSAAAFGAQGVIVQDRHTPALGGVVAKAAAGALDRLPHARVVNLSRALETLDEHGWRTVGLDGAAEAQLETALDGRPTALVLGSEGEGLRRLVAEHCDTLARIDMPGGFESLNVSAAAAVALYAAARAQHA